MQPQPLNVRHQMPGGVVLQFRVRCGLAAATLIEGDDAEALGIIVASVLGIAATPGPPVQVQHRRTLGVAGLLPIQGVQSIHRQHSGVVGL